MHRRLSLGIAACMALAAQADETAAQSRDVKVGLVLPMTGPLAAVGNQVAAGAQLYVQQHGDVVAGRKINLIIKDDGGAPDRAVRLTQDMLANDHIDVLGGGLTPSALAIAPLATQAKVPEVVMISGTSILTERSPYVVRVSFTMGQSAGVLAHWAAANGSRDTAVVQADWSPGAEATAVFTDRFKADGGNVLEVIKVPLANPDFAPFLQRARDLKPDTLFAYVPAWQAGTFAKQFIERGLGASGIRIVGPGDLTDDADLPHMGDEMIGTITAWNYSAAHDSAVNKAYVAAFKAANNGLRPNFLSVGGYDGMHAIYEALRRTNGATDGDKLVEAMKGLAWESPRGPIAIDPETRDIVQNIYMRKVEKVGGELYNVEFATFEAVKDPAKVRK